MNNKERLEILNMIYAVIDYGETESQEMENFKKSMLQQVDNLSDDIQGINK